MRQRHAANLVIKRHGADAVIEAARMVDRILTGFVRGQLRMEAGWGAGEMSPDLRSPNDNCVAVCAN